LALLLRWERHLLHNNDLEVVAVAVVVAAVVVEVMQDQRVLILLLLMVTPMREDVAEVVTVEEGMIQDQRVLIPIPMTMREDMKKAAAAVAIFTKVVKKLKCAHVPAVGARNTI
jgi:hypothetical protein